MHALLWWMQAGESQTLSRHAVFMMCLLKRAVDQPVDLVPVKQNKPPPLAVDESGMYYEVNRV
jgi:hypothetical protein